MFVDNDLVVLYIMKKALTFLLKFHKHFTDFLNFIWEDNRLSFIDATHIPFEFWKHGGGYKCLADFTDYLY